MRDSLRFSAVLALLLPAAVFAATSASLPSLSQPSLSPDGHEIAFVSGGDIWSVPAEGGEAHLLVSNPATESRPLWSPDGARLAFVSTRTGNGDIYVLTLATGQLTRITYADAAEDLDAWSADGRWLYFTSNSPTTLPEPRMSFALAPMAARRSKSATSDTSLNSSRRRRPTARPWP